MYMSLISNKKWLNWNVFRTYDTANTAVCSYLTFVSPEHSSCSLSGRNYLFWRLLNSVQLSTSRSHFFEQVLNLPTFPTCWTTCQCTLTSTRRLKCKKGKLRDQNWSTKARTVICSVIAGDVIKHLIYHNWAWPRRSE